MSEEKLGLFMLDKVDIDYPTVMYPAVNEDFPLYSFAKYGEAYYPIGEWSLTIDPDQDDYMIMGRTIDTTNHTITFSVREVI